MQPKPPALRRDERVAQGMPNRGASAHLNRRQYAMTVPVAANDHPSSTSRPRPPGRIAIVTWIERTYHRRRRQVTLGRLTPVEYELIMTTPATQVD
jgi:transposase InsO family protein